MCVRCQHGEWMLEALVRGIRLCHIHVKYHQRAQMAGKHSSKLYECHLKRYKHYEVCIKLAWYMCPMYRYHWRIKTGKRTFLCMIQAREAYSKENIQPIMYTCTTLYHPLFDCTTCHPNYVHIYIGKLRKCSMQGIAWTLAGSSRCRHIFVKAETAAE